VGYSIPLESAGTSLDFTVTLGNVSDPDVGDDYIYYGIGVNLPYKLTEKATFAVGAQYASNDLDGSGRQPPLVHGRPDGWILI
jgi:hypothetical protein